MIRTNFNFLKLSFGLLAIDQLLKYFLRSFLDNFIFINQNYIFGLRIDLASFYLIFFVCVVLIWGILSKDKLGQAMIFAGGLSNIIDRVSLGGVVDLQIKNLIAFNLADLFIVAGVLVVFYQLIKE